MAKTILGLDIGSVMIKASWLSQSLKDTRIFKTACEPVHPHAGTEDIAQKIKNIVLSGPETPDSMILVLNSGNVLLQRLFFPFSKPARIEEVLPFELENILPVSPEDYIVDFLFSGERQEDGNEVITALYGKDYLLELVQSLKKHGLHPDRIDLDLSALAGVAKTGLADKSHKPLLLDIGWSKTNAVWAPEGRVRVFRSLPVGLESILRDAGEETDPRDHAKIKQAMSRLDMKNKDENELPAALSELEREIKFSLSATESDNVPDMVLLAGGGANLEFVRNFLQERLETRVLNIERALSEGQKDVTAETVLAAAATGQKNPRRDGFDFLRGELADKKQNTLAHGQIRFAAVAACVILFLWVGTFGFDLYLQNQKLERLETRLEQTFRGIVPQAPDSVQPMQYASVIRSRIAAMDGASVDAEIPPAGTVALLSRISRALPEKLQMQTTLFSLDRNTIRLNGLARDFKTVDAIKNRLNGIGQFSEVKIVGANADKRGEGVLFNLHLSIEEPV